MVTKKESQSAKFPPSRRNDPVPVVEIIYRRTEELKRSPHRVRKVKRKHVKRIQASIERFGFSQPILVRGDEIVDGCTRAAAAENIGLDAIPCIDVSHLSDDDIRLLRITLNKLQERGAWDEPALKLELAHQLKFNQDISVAGFEAWEVDAVLEIGAGEDLADETDTSFDTPDKDAPAITRPGDLWCLGDHRILCGNARSEADIARLVDGQLVALIFTDPPYGVPINGHVSSSGRHPEFHEGSGEMSSKQMEDFLAITIGNAASILVVGGLVYIFMDWRHLDELSAALKRCALEHIQTCVWAKEHPGMGSFYRSQHEHVYIARKPGATHRNNIELGAHGRNRSNLWQFAGATGGRADDADDFTVHPTVKPVKLIEEAILDVTMAGETVFDPFLGSGSTLLASERTQRRCLGLEVSAVYVDLAIRRWQAMTGKAAVHAQTGTPFDRLLQQETEPEPPIEEDF